MNDAPLPPTDAEGAVIERPARAIEQPYDEPMTNETVLYRLDDVTLEITGGTWTEMAKAMGAGALPQELFHNLIYGRLMIYPGFVAYYHRDEAFLKDMKLDIEIVRDYADTKKRLRTPCYVTDMVIATELSEEIIGHIFNVRRGRSPQ